MRKHSEFDQRTGRISTPTADLIPRQFEDLRPTLPTDDLEAKLYKICSIAPLTGCYKLTFRPASGLPPEVHPTTFKGTMRFEDNGTDLIVSADLYRFKSIYPLEYYRVPSRYNLQWGHLTIGEEASEIDFGFQRPDAETVGPAQLPSTKRIPIYQRDKYHSYLKGVSARLTSIGFAGFPCSLSLTFDEFFYEHPDSGYDGDFPSSPDRRIRMQLDETNNTKDFEGALFEGEARLGTVTLEWVSPYFRRAELKINKLDGAEIPQPIPASLGTGTVDFASIFAGAGWQLNVLRDDTAVPLPESLVGEQVPNGCWNPDYDDMHTLMESLPGYDPNILDTRWRAHLIAIPATLGCSRGWMFDSIASGGDNNRIGREGAVTHSHDGYPSWERDTYGAAEDELQKDYPRAFLRSASHEVGHIFNQIHQDAEGGADNSIMTTTPRVATVLDTAGQSFPDDISLAFNATVQRHLIHLPDPAVRPGAMQFFGLSNTAPEADVSFLDSDDLELALTANRSVKLGEPLNIAWTLSNKSGDPIPAPDHIGASGHSTHLSVTDASGSIRYVKSPKTEPCSSHRVSDLKPNASRIAEATLFWSPNGFSFETPGRHRIELILLWDVNRLVLGARGAVEVWVDYPSTSEDNAVAALLLNEDVGRLITFGDGNRFPKGKRRVAEALKNYPDHPASGWLEANAEHTHKGRDKKAMENGSSV